MRNKGARFRSKPVDGTSGLPAPKQFPNGVAQHRHRLTLPSSKGLPVLALQMHKTLAPEDQAHLGVFRDLRRQPFSTF
jgi:hypothetical protein